VHAFEYNNGHLATSVQVIPLDLCLPRNVSKSSCGSLCAPQRYTGTRAGNSIAVGLALW
jgi:hypothetical protein